MSFGVPTVLSCLTTRMLSEPEPSLRGKASRGTLCSVGARCKVLRLALDWLRSIRLLRMKSGNSLSQ
jgi:hypothetical protein